MKKENEDNRDYIQYPTKDDFPETGAENTVYLDVETNTDYVWDAGHSAYRVEGDRPPKPPRIP